MKNNKVFKQSLNNKIDKAYPYLSDVAVFDHESTPHISIDTNIEIVSQNEVFKTHFLKATIVTYPKFQKYRDDGIYYFGKAKGVLIHDKDGRNLKIETTSWDGLKDMEIIQEKIHAGLITPTVSYENEQRKSSHPLEILRQILASRSLTSIQRFFLALRLTKA